MKATPVTSVAFGLVSVTVSTLATFVPTVAGAKDLAAVRPPRTVIVAFAAAVEDPPFAVESAPSPMEFG